MKKIYKIFIIDIVLYLFTSCIRYINWDIFAYNTRYDAYRPDSTEMIGTWMAEDSARIVLNGDGTCSLQNVQRVITYSGHPGNDTSSVWTFDGHWCIKPELSYSHPKDTIGYLLYLSNRPSHRTWFEDGEYEIELNVHNEKVSSEIVPTLLYDFVGDPDQFNFYVFKKQE